MTVPHERPTAQFLTRALPEPASKHFFVMTWQGDEMPQGSSIGRIDIAYIMNGTITGKNGQNLGCYHRLAKADGHGENIILIGTNHSEITPPPGGTVQLAKDVTGEYVLDVTETIAPPAQSAPDEWNLYAG